MTDESSLIRLKMRKMDEGYRSRRMTKMLHQYWLKHQHLEQQNCLDEDVHTAIENSSLYTVYHLTLYLNDITVVHQFISKHLIDEFHHTDTPTILHLHSLLKMTHDSKTIPDAHTTHGSKPISSVLIHFTFIFFFRRSSL